jgi:hypothetical protein
MYLKVNAAKVDVDVYPRRIIMSNVLRFPIKKFKPVMQRHPATINKAKILARLNEMGLKYY